jgi:hypothetical protein
MAFIITGETPLALVVRCRRWLESQVELARLLGEHRPSDDELAHRAFADWVP